jgi:hypothetical protein
MGFDGNYKDEKWIVSINREKNLIIEERGELYEVQCIGMNGNVLVDRVFFMGPISEEEVWELIWRLRLEGIDGELTIEESGLNYKDWFDGFGLYESDLLFGGSCLWRRTVGDVIIDIGISGNGRNIMYERKEDSFFEVLVYSGNSKIRSEISQSKSFGIGSPYNNSDILSNSIDSVIIDNSNSSNNSGDGNNGIYSYNYSGLPCYYRGYISYYIVLEIIDMFIREYGGVKEKRKIFFLKGQAP